MKSLKNFSYLLVLILGISLTSCDDLQICEQGEGPVVVQTLNIDPMTGFRLDVSAEVFISEGATQSVEVHAQQNIIDLLETDVQNDIWDIDIPGCVNTDEEIEIYITLPKLEYAKIAGSGDVVGQTSFTTDDLELDISGSGYIELDVDAQSVSTKISGSGDVVLDLDTDDLISRITGSGKLTYAGTATTHDSRSSGSGKLFAYDLITDESLIRINGSGDAEVYADQTLDVNIAGSGNVSFKGNAALEVNITGSGKVIDAN
ncbi:MAG: head GIN domain-containing protein [Bacteroidota bacterium]